MVDFLFAIKYFTDSVIYYSFDDSSVYNSKYYRRNPTPCNKIRQDKSNYYSK